MEADAINEIRNNYLITYFTSKLHQSFSITYSENFLKQKNIYQVFIYQENLSNFPVTFKLIQTISIEPRNPKYFNGRKSSREKMLQEFNACHDRNLATFATFSYGDNLFSYLLQHLILHDFQLFWEDVFFPVISSYKVEQQAFFLAFHLRLLFAFQVFF